jgi:hypothetical protein
LFTPTISASSWTSASSARSSPLAKAAPPVIPFALIEIPDLGVQTVRIIGTGAVEEARGQIRSWRPTPVRYAIVCETALTLENQSRSDAILVEAGERGSPTAGVYTRMFRRGESGCEPTAERQLLKTTENLVGTSGPSGHLRQGWLVAFCPGFGAKNRIALARLCELRPRCGACKSSLIEEDASTED